MALRVALGATARSIMQRVLCRSLTLVVAGFSVGFITALFGARLLSRFLFGIIPSDPLTLLSVGILFLLVVLVAGYFPARKASRSDPLMALRAE